jgi:Zn-dependent peptidase ImmA (M78 family)/transcriptional regulator with XRE-family HTH domain
MKPKFNFKMLTLARESRGLTQAELSDKTKTDPSNLSRFEVGKASPSEDILKKYAKVLNYPIDFFYQQGPVTPISDFFYRKRITIPAKEKSKLEAQVEIIRFVYNILLKSVSIPDIKFPTVSISKRFTASDAAMLTREYFGIKKGPITDLISTLEKRGIAVILINSESEKFDGMTVYTDSNHPIIILNKNRTNDRLRFTICHELAHQVEHLPFRYGFEMYERLKDNPDALEIEADSFAAEFLMPSSEIRNELINLTYGKLSQLKAYWQVSKKALIYRAKTLKSINDVKYKNLLIELSRHGERVQESFDVELDKPKLFNQIIRAYIEKLNYSPAELAEILFISEADLFNLGYLNGYSKLRIAI